MATGCHVEVDDPLMLGEECVEDIESATDIVLEGDSDASANVLAATGTGS
jgi:hypothetical protein